MTRARYRKKADSLVAAVQLDLDTPGLDYRKWGDRQQAHAGDWLVDNDGDVYTVEQETFARTYRRVALGQYVKVTPVWAEKAAAPGSVPTKEGRTHYAAGDYLVSNDEAGNDPWAIAAERFEQLYEPDEA